ncbi:GGDEF domain-containing protein [Krasilnikovia cinnamomea]|uniref:GGDEF domain-containing protein n=1 Tax=Krasilnikovia cinnamomea TaxID=349313 RepID=UPI001F5F0BB3|nr:GGDEF domain-containing protein [Krasilnikovia cinnamomea]
MGAAAGADRAWAWVGGLGLLVITAFLLLPNPTASAVMYDGIEFACVAAMVAGVRRNRPAAVAGWSLLIAGQAASVVADIMFDVYALVLHDDSWPGPWDVAYLISYLGTISGLCGLLLRRNRGRGYAGFVDSLLVGVAFALLSWVFLIRYIAAGETMGTLGHVVTLAYPCLDLVVLVLVLWLLTTDGKRRAAFLLLVAGMATALIADHLWAFVDMTSYDPALSVGRYVSASYLLSFLLLAMAITHPGMVAVGLPTPAPVTRPMSWQRLGLLAGAVLIAPALLAWQALTGNGTVRDALPIAVASAAMFLLGLTRMTMLVRRLHRQARVMQQQAERLRELAEQDPLTGLPNRRTWDSALPAALVRAGRDGTPVSVAIIDLDHFKAFNDRHGHQMGDRLLKEAAAVWADGLRDGDLLARYGGEEFVALLPDADETEATRVLDRLRRRTPMGCTFSAGLAIWDGRESGEALLHRADRALYRAKAAGRDRVERAQAAAPGPRSMDLAPGSPELQESLRHLG